MENTSKTQRGDRAERWPALPYEAWRNTCQTLHLWTQIVGKVRMGLSPFLNHWWHVPLYVTPRGLTTSAIPLGLLGKGSPDSKRKGHISESAIVTRFLECGYVVLTPFGGSERYDLVIEDVDGQFWRIQCKSGWIENGAIYFDAANHNVTGTKRDWRHYRGQCEYFAVYCADLGKVYIVPVDQVGRTRAHLRIEPTKNKQEKNVRWARDYEL